MIHTFNGPKFFNLSYRFYNMYELYEKKDKILNRITEIII